MMLMFLNLNPYNRGEQIGYRSHAPEGLIIPRNFLPWVTGADGIASFDMVWKGTYNIRIYKVGLMPI